MVFLICCGRRKTLRHLHRAQKGTLWAFKRPNGYPPLPEKCGPKHPLFGKFVHAKRSDHQVKYYKKVGLLDMNLS